MNDRPDKTETPQQSGQTRPVMHGYAVRPIGEGRKSSWSKIAAAWAHKDGRGFEVRMDAMPVDGRLVLRAVPEEDAQEADVIETAPKGLG